MADSALGTKKDAATESSSRTMVSMTTQRSQNGFVRNLTAFPDLETWQDLQCMLRLTGNRGSGSIEDGTQVHAVTGY
jgi:hypothetical protein